MSPRFARQFVNSVGGTGYIFCMLQWLWAAALYLPVLIDSDLQRYLVPDTPHQAAPAPTQLAGPQELWMFVALVITACVIIISIVVFVRLPASLAKTGRAITKKSATSLAPIVTGHRQIKPAEKRRLIVRLTRLVKLGLMLIPLAASLFAYFFDIPLDYSITVWLASLLALLTLLFFAGQYGLARWLKVPDEKLL